MARGCAVAAQTPRRPSWLNRQEAAGGPHAKAAASPGQPPSCVLQEIRYPLAKCFSCGSLNAGDADFKYSSILNTSNTRREVVGAAQPKSL